MKKLSVVFAGLILGLIAMPAMADLQGILDGITVPPPSSVNVNTDAIPETQDYYWQIGGSGGAVSTLIFEAQFPGDDVFGIYDAADPSTKVQLFSGAAGPGDQSVLSIMADGSVRVNFADTGIDFQAGNLFGFYLESPSGTFYSDSALNGGADHMLAFQGTDEDVVQLPGGFAPGPWATNEFILAWEDGTSQVSFAAIDLPDFADFVVMVESVSPVPVPAAVLLGLLGLGAAGLKLRRFA